MGGGIGTGCGPDEFWASAVVVRTMHAAEKTSAAPLQENNESGMQILWTAPPGLPATQVWEMSGSIAGAES